MSIAATMSSSSMPRRCVFTGRKRDQKIYYWHTGHPGGIKERTARRSSTGAFPSALSRRPSSACCRDGPLARTQLENLRVYKGAEHPHEAQQPEVARRRRAEPQEREDCLNHGRLCNPSQDLGQHGRGAVGTGPRPEARRSGPRLCHRQAQGRHRPRLDQAAAPAASRSTARTRPMYFARPVLQMMIAPAVPGDRSRRPVRHRCARFRRRSVGPGRRGASRHLARR